MSDTTAPDSRYESPPGSLSVSTTVRQGGIPMGELTEEFTIPGMMPLVPGEPHAEVEVGWKDSRCVDFNTTSVEVKVRMPCRPTRAAVEQAEALCSDLVRDAMEREKGLVGGTFAMQRGHHSIPPPPMGVPPASRRQPAPQPIPEGGIASQPLAPPFRPLPSYTPDA